MKPIYNKTALENFLTLVKVANPAVDINSDQVTINTPVTSPITNLTTIKLAAVLDNGYSGEVELSYTRRKLEEYIVDGEYLKVDSLTNLNDLSELITSTLGLVKSEVTIDLVSLPDISTSDVVLLEIGVNDSIVYEETTKLRIYITTINFGEEEYRTGVGGKVRVTKTGLYRHLVPLPVQLGVFYGGKPDGNTVTRISAEGTLVGVETQVGTARAYLAGAGYTPQLGIFYGGHTGTITNLTTRISDVGILVGSETQVGTARAYLAGAGYTSTLGIFYGGAPNGNTATRISNLGTLVGAETQVGIARYALAGAGYTPTLGLFYGGRTNGNTVTRISAEGTLVGSETQVDTDRHSLAGASYTATLGIFYGGQYTAITNLTTRISNLGTLIGSETTAGTARSYLAGASYTSTLGLFYGGGPVNSPTNIVTRISPSGTLVGVEVSVGTARNYLEGAGYR